MEGYLTDMAATAGARLDVYPDEREVFYWDGKPVLEMHPLRLDYEHTVTGYTLRVTRDYRML